MIFVFRKNVILLTFHFVYFYSLHRGLLFGPLELRFCIPRQFPRQIPTSPIVDRSFPIVVRTIPIGHQDRLIYKGFSPRSRVLFHPQFTKVPPVSHFNFTFLPVIYHLVLPVECYLWILPVYLRLGQFPDSECNTNYLNQFTILQNLSFSTD